MLSSQFQRYCRDLHTEAASFVAQQATPTAARQLMFRLLTHGRSLEVGNPTAGRIGSDFARFDIKIWEASTKARPATRARQDELEKEILEWRNAIAHQDDKKLVVLGGTLWLSQVQGWRRTCNQLVKTFDNVLAGHLQRMFGTTPW